MIKRPLITLKKEVDMAKAKKKIKRPDRAIAMKGNKYAVGADNGRPREWTDKEIDIERHYLEEWIKNPANYYTLSFLNDRHLSPEHVSRFCSYNKDFRDSWGHAKSVMEARLIDLAVSKKGDGNFIKFILQNKAGWKEKSEVSGDANNPLSFVLDRISKKVIDPLELDYDG